MTFIYSSRLFMKGSRSWMIIFDKTSSSFFFILQTNPTLIHKFVEGKGKECNIYDILASIFFLA
jgi:hypothetical protein